MLVSEPVLKWAMRLYPPFLFQRIWTQRFEAGFSGVRVKIFKSILNRNYNQTIFGGTIYSAADPFYVILFHQILKRKGFTVQLWSRKASVEFIKPGNCNLYFQISLTSESISEAVQKLKEEGKFIKTFPVKITNKEGVLYAILHNEIYIKLMSPQSKSAIE